MTKRTENKKQNSSPRHFQYLPSSPVSSFKLIILGFMEIASLTVKSYQHSKPFSSNFSLCIQ